MPRNKELEAYTPVGVLCFADNLWKARPAAQGAAPRYSCIFLFDKRGVNTEAYQKLRRACAIAIGDKWGAAKAQDPNFTRTLRLPFRSARDKEYEGFEDGEIFVSPWSPGDQRRPPILNLNDVELPHPEVDVWSGQLARGLVRAFAYDNSGNRGIGLGLQCVQIVDFDKPRLDGRRSASDAFKDADNSELEALGIDPKAPVGMNPDLSDMPF